MHAIDLWKSKRSKPPTVADLVEVLERCKMRFLAGILKDKYLEPTGEQNGNHEAPALGTVRNEQDNRDDTTQTV